MPLDSICKIENVGAEIIKHMDENGQQSRDMTKEKIDVKVSEPVAICDQLLIAEEQQPSSQEDIARLIMDIRGMQVMIDRDLAALYGVETKRLNEQVRRNIERFPERFRFRLTKQETNELVANCDRLNMLKHSTVMPYVFTEQGISMLSTVLHSPTAIAVSIKIMDAFVSMRRFIAANAQLFQRLETIEYHQLEMKRHLEVTDKRIDEVFKRIDANIPPVQGIFYDGQVFDAYRFVSELIRKATQSIVLIDNYVDDTVLALLDKRAERVSATIYTQRVSNQFQLDIDRHNAQYPYIEIKQFNKAHDRFLLIDEEVYHIGASVKDLGKKWFGFTLMRDITATELIERIQD